MFKTVFTLFFLAYAFPANPEGTLVRIFESCWYLFLSVSIFWSSSFVIFVIVRTPQLHYPPGYLMVCMSLCDVFMSLLIGSATLPALDHSFQYHPWICHGQALLLAFFQNVNAMCLMVSALDQFVSIYWPLKYYQLVTTKRLIATFALIGFCGTVVPAIWAMLDNSWFDDYLYICFLVSTNYILTNMQLLLMFLTPGVVILICYLLILVSVWKDKSMAIKEHKQGRRNSAAAQGMQIVAQLNACKMLFLVTVVFFLSFLPYMALDRYMYITGHVPQNVWIFKVSGWMIFIQSLLNFMLFYKMNVGFKRGAHRYFEKLPILNRIVEEPRGGGGGQRQPDDLDENNDNSVQRASFMTNNSPRPSNYQLAIDEDGRLSVPKKEKAVAKSSGASFGNTLTLELAVKAPVSHA